MPEFQYVSNYLDNPVLRKSFFNLAMAVFHIDFENWHQKGYRDNSYQCHSYADGNKIIANVSVSLLDLIVAGKLKKAIQIGTVMTDPDYRGRGLSRKLMEAVLKQVENQCDFLYLFANPSVLDFYPKFGFKKVPVYIFSLDISKLSLKEAKIRQLKIDNPEDLDIIYGIASHRVPVSRTFGSAGGRSLLMWYCLNVFKNSLYLLEDDNCVIIFDNDAERINIYDVVSDREINLVTILVKTVRPGIQKAVFHFTPDSMGLKADFVPFNSHDTLFIRPHNAEIPINFKHPQTLQA